MANIIEELKMKINGKGLRIVFPEIKDERVIQAAIKLQGEGLINPILIGNREDIPSEFNAELCESEG